MMLRNSQDQLTDVFDLSPYDGKEELRPMLGALLGKEKLTA